MSQLVAVIDIGKTNKKIVLFDRQLGVVAVRQASFPAKMGPEGLLIEQIEAIWLWLTRELTTLYRAHPFHALSVSTHGATWVALDQTGRPCLPVIAYEHDLGPAGQAGLDEDFYRLCGSSEALQEETGTCDMPLLVNPAKAIRFAQRRLPGQWARVRRILNYPQFWGYLLTGEMAAEATYTANHSFLFDPRSKGPSSAAKALGVDQLVDWNLRKPWERLGVLRGDLQRELGLPALPVTVGIHDSNGALLPYLIKHGDQDFVLNSTGTWCVAMHKVAQLTYRPEEIGRKIIFNIDALGDYQKVSFLMGGMDYGLYHEAIGGNDPGYDQQRLDAALAHGDRAILPGAYPSQFPKVRGGVREGPTIFSVDDLRARRRPHFFSDTASAHDLLNVSLALQSEVALRRTDIADGTTIYIEGGFRNNATFVNVLATLFPRNPVAVTSLAQASAAGAAILGHALLNHCHPRSLANAIRIDTKPVERVKLANLAAYQTAWSAMADGKIPAKGPAIKPKPTATAAKPAPTTRPAPSAKPTPVAQPQAPAAASTVHAKTVKVPAQAPSPKPGKPVAATAKPTMKPKAAPAAPKVSTATPAKPVTPVRSKATTTTKKPAVKKVASTTKTKASVPKVKPTAKAKPKAKAPLKKVKRAAKPKVKSAGAKAQRRRAR